MKIFKGELSGIEYQSRKMLGEGGQGYVIGVVDPESGEKKAVKWFKKLWSTEKHRKQIGSLVEKGPPRVKTDDIRFIWPEELVSMEGREGFGYVMPLIDKKSFHDYYDLTDYEVSLPLRTVCRISYNLVSALRYVNGSGRCYGDINFGNVMFDPETGRIIVCDNDNVVVNGSPSGIGGVVEFMAPEVALGDTHPNRDSDIFSLAVTLYHFFMWHHPLDGKKTQSIRCWDNIAKTRFFAEQPVFVFDPDNEENSTEGLAELNFHHERWTKLCPPSLKRLFTKTFTAGLKDAAERVQSNEWQRLLLECEGNAVTCKCGARTVWSQMGWPCFKCGADIRTAVALRFVHPHSDDVQLAGVPGAKVRKHHLDPFALDPENDVFKQFGSILEHPKAGGHVIIRNETESPWEMVTSRGDTVAIEPGKARPLAPGAHLKIEGVNVEGT